MTEQEEFNEWFNYFDISGCCDYGFAQSVWQGCSERKNAIIEKQALEIERLRSIIPGSVEELNDELCDENEKQAKELEALRGFTKECLDGMPITAERHGLIDENGNPTPILTGETK